MVGHHLVDAGVVAGDIFSKLAKDYRYLSIIDLQSLVYVEKELKKRDEMEGMEKERDLLLWRSRDARELEDDNG